MFIKKKTLYGLLKKCILKPYKKGQIKVPKKNKNSFSNLQSTNYFNL